MPIFGYRMKAYKMGNPTTVKRIIAAEKKPKVAIKKEKNIENDSKKINIPNPLTLLEKNCFSDSLPTKEDLFFSSE